MPHFITADPSNHFVFVTTKGGPYVAQMRFDPATGHLEPNRPARVASAPGAGPRHMDFHPNHRFAYVINEQAMTLTTYAFDQNKGTLAEIESVPTVPRRHPGQRPQGLLHRRHPRAPLGQAAVRLQPGSQQHRHLQGRRQHRTAEPGGARDPAHRPPPATSTSIPSGSLLFVANQDDGTVTVFRIDAASGRLDLVGPPHAGRGQALIRRGGDAAGSMTDCTS
jgi:6-phosphogluconolactonase